eukprot:m51a1_g2001 hypothetical protein (1248) ;mRNA; f:1219516-1226216
MSSSGFPSSAAGAWEACDTRGVLPCSDSWTGNVFLVAVFGWILAAGARTMAEGSELLLDVLHPGFIGGLIIPLLGSLPDTAIIFVSICFGSAETAREQITIGVGTLTGSTIMLLTIAWVAGLIAGRCDIDNGKSVDRRLTQKWSTSPHLDPPTGITTERDIRANAMIMCATTLPYLIVQAAAFVDMLRRTPMDRREKHQEDCVMVAFVITCVLFVAYSAYMVFNTTLQERRMRAARRKHMVEKLASMFVESVRRQEELGGFEAPAANENNPEVSPLMAEEDHQEGEHELQSVNEIARRAERAEVGSALASAVTARQLMRPKSMQYGDEIHTMVHNWRSHAKDLVAAQDLAEEEQQRREEAGDDLVPERMPTGKLVLRAGGMLAVGTGIVVLFSEPMVSAIDNLSRSMSVPNFYVSFLVTPFASNASELIASIYFCSKKTSKNVSMAMAAVYGAVTMNSTLNLAVFLIMMWARDITYMYSSEVVPMLLVIYAVGALASLRDTFTTLQGFVVCGPPLVLGAVSWGWGKCRIVVNSSSEVRNSTLTVGIVDSISSLNNVDEVMAICLALQNAVLPRGHDFSILFYDDQGKVMVGFPVVGIIGGFTSELSVALQDAGVSASGIPQVAYSATSTLLSNKTRFPHFLRTPATDALTSNAIVMLLAQYGVTKIAMMGTDDSYGRGGISNVKLYASRLATPIQIVTESYFSPTLSSPEALFDAQASGVDTIVAFCLTDTCVPLLEQARVLNMLNKPKVWILGAGDLASVIRQNTTILCLSTGLVNGVVKNQFEVDMLQFANRSGFTSWTYFAHDAALAYITAIKQNLWDRTALFETLMALHFTGASGPISFDQNGDRFATVTITSWQPGATTQTTIGNWSIGSGVVIDPQYEIYPPPISVDWGSPESLPLGAIVGGTVGAAVALLAVGAGLLVLQQRSRRSLLIKVDMERNKFLVPSDEIKLGQEVGRGSFGAVYIATWRGTQVAAKVILGSRVKEDAATSEQFNNEVGIMKSLRHPNVLLFMCYSQDKDKLIIFMPSGSLMDVLLDETQSITLRSRMSILKDVAAGMAYLHSQKVDSVTMYEIEHQIKEIAILSEVRHPSILLFEVLADRVVDMKQADSILSSVCNGMLYLHMSNIVHRDLKSNNILLNKKWDVKLSVGWMAPEVLKEGKYSEKSDVFSFGMVMYEILTRSSPYRGLPMIQISAAIQSGKRPPVPPSLGTFSTKYVSLMEACWDHEAVLRPGFKKIAELLNSMV